MEAQPQNQPHPADEDDYYDVHDDYDDTSHLKLFSSLYSGVHSKLIAEHMLVIKGDPRYQRMSLRYAPGWHTKDLWQRAKKFIDYTLIPYIGILFHFFRAFHSARGTQRAVRLVNTLRQYRVSRETTVAASHPISSPEVVTPDGSVAHNTPSNTTDQEKLIMTLLEPDLRCIEVTTAMNKVKLVTAALFQLILFVGPAIVAPPLLLGEPITKLPIGFLTGPIAKAAEKIEKKKKLQQEKTLKNWPFIPTSTAPAANPTSPLLQEHSFTESNIRDIGIRKNVHRKWGATKALLVYLGLPADRDPLYSDFEASRLFLKGLLGAWAEDDLLAMGPAAQPLLDELLRQESKTSKGSPYNISSFPPIFRDGGAAASRAAYTATSTIPPPPVAGPSREVSPVALSADGAAAVAAAEGKPERDVGVGFELWVLLFRLYDCWGSLPYVSLAHQIGNLRYTLTGKRNQRDEIRRQRKLLRDVQVIAAQLPRFSSSASLADADVAKEQKGLHLPFLHRWKRQKVAASEVRSRLLTELQGAHPSGVIPAGWVVRQFGRANEKVVEGWLRTLLPFHPLAQELLRPLEGPFAQLSTNPPQKERDSAHWQETRETLLAEADHWLRWLSRFLAKRFCREGQVWGSFARQAYPDLSGPLSASPLAHAAQTGPLKLQGLMLGREFQILPPNFTSLKPKGLLL